MRRVCVFFAAAVGARPDYALAAETLGRAVAARGLGLVFGGGAVGLMGVVSRTALAAGAAVTGIIPHGLVTREAGNGDLPDLRVVASMHERKAMMAELSDGFLVLPNFTAQEEVDAMRKRAGEIVDAFEPSTFTVFSTKGQVRRGYRFVGVRGGLSYLESRNSLGQE